jgi:hypothetical protein
MSALFRLRRLMLPIPTNRCFNIMPLHNSLLFFREDYGITA